MYTIVVMTDYECIGYIFLVIFFSTIYDSYMFIPTDMNRVRLLYQVLIEQITALKVS